MNYARMGNRVLLIGLLTLTLAYNLYTTEMRNLEAAAWQLRLDRITQTLSKLSSELHMSTAQLNQPCTRAVSQLTQDNPSPNHPQPDPTPTTDAAKRHTLQQTQAATAAVASEAAAHPPDAGVQLISDSHAQQLRTQLLDRAKAGNESLQKLLASPDLERLPQQEKLAFFAELSAWIEHSGVHPTLLFYSTTPPQSNQPQSKPIAARVTAP